MWQKVSLFILTAVILSGLLLPTSSALAKTNEAASEEYFQGAIIERSEIVTQVSEETEEEHTSAKVDKTYESSKKSWWESLKDTIVDTASSFATSTVNFFKGTAVSIKEGTQKIVYKTVNTGKSIVSGFRNSVVQTFHRVGNTLKTVKSITVVAAKIGYNWKFPKPACARYSIEEANANVPIDEESITIFVNGILTNHDGYNCAIKEIRQAFPKGKMKEMHNPTAIELSLLKMLGAPYDVLQSFADIMQGKFGDRFFLENETVNQLVDEIKASDGKPMTLIGHSQGTAILSAALRKAKDEGVDLSNVTVYLFANVAWDFPAGTDKDPTYYQCLHTGDTLTTFSIPYVKSIENNSVPKVNFKLVEGPSSNPDFLFSGPENHNLSIYLKDYKSGKCAQ